ncbi:MAG: argininosuccinate synthase [Planctomycetes bacterium]|nr:argininosuccinate synthase [Planctomycetota bacterium]
MPKVALAYSGKLNTAICVHWLCHERGLKVVTLSIDLGQPKYLEPLGEKAIEMGAHSAHIADLREEFLQHYVLPSLRAGAKYQAGYYLGGALSRPLIISKLIDLAHEEGCDFVAHGCRGVGNDQIRLERSIRCVAPDLEILAPLQDLGLKSPAHEQEYARARGIVLEPTGNIRESLYNLDQTLWGVSIGLPPYYDLSTPPPDDTYVMTTKWIEAPERPTTIRIGFEAGIPFSLDGETLPPIRLVQTLNKIGGRYAIGRFDYVEDRIAGGKSRELYEAPAATLLYAAHTALEEIVLTKQMMNFKEMLSRKYAELVYEGWYFTDLRRALDAFFADASACMTGTITLSLGRGTLHVTGRESPYTLYRPSDDIPHHHDTARRVRPSDGTSRG